MKLTGIILFVILYNLTSTPSAYSTVSVEKFSSNGEMCEYLKGRKEAAEQAMKNGYTAAQYDGLEMLRKYWKKQYVDRCF